MHQTDRICHICKERKEIFCFQSVYVPEVKKSVYICHKCTVDMQYAAIYDKGLDNLNLLSTPTGEW